MCIYVHNIFTTLRRNERRLLSTYSHASSTFVSTTLSPNPYEKRLVVNNFHIANTTTSFLE